MKFFYSSLFLLATFHPAFGQKIYNEIITINLDRADFSKKLQQINRENLSIVNMKNVADIDEKIDLFTLNKEISELELSSLKDEFGEKVIGFNQYLNKRDKPNDTHYDKQWALQFANIPKVWDITTGGLTSKDINNQEIVVGVLDDGMDITHPDLKDNIFINKGEIPDDEIDNDGNGYKDDYKGYNVNLNNGEVYVRIHGTSVCGIIGAKGNNGEGITGINWNIKILPVYGVNKFDEIIAGYSYLLKMRRLYNTTSGQKGALVVVTNYSGGIDKVFGTDDPYKKWCDLYDKMGNEGILSVGATINENVNVTQLGDMPSTCTSPYFLSVTNIDKTGNKVLRAGYSTKYLSLAAPGEDLIALKPDALLDPSFSGTSASTPMVAGVIALLFSLPCNSFDSLIRFDKTKAALIIKDAILKGVTKTKKLEDYTISGGYLNALNALSLLKDACKEGLLLPSQKGDLDLLNVEAQGNNYLVSYVTPDEDKEYFIMAADLMGRILFREKLTVPMFGDKVYFLENNGNLRGPVSVGIYSESAIVSKLFYFGE